MIPAAGGQQRLVVRAPEGTEIHSTVGIAWTPDGRWLIYGSAKTPENEDTNFGPKERKLWRVSVDGGSPQDLKLSVEGLRQIALHPDGRRIAFTADAPEAAGLSRGIWTLENFLSPLAANR